MKQENKTKMEKTLLQEYFYIDYTPQIIKESIDKNGGKLIVPCILQKADTINENGRIYPRNILESQINKYQKMVSERRALGELDHPDYANIALSKVSHLITEIWWDGNIVRGKLEVLDTTNGRELKALLLAGVRVGISSRALGSTIRENNAEMVQEDLQLICFDAVSTPSTPGAFLFENVKNINTQVKRDYIIQAINEFNKELK